MSTVHKENAVQGFEEKSEENRWFWSVYHAKICYQPDVWLELVKRLHALQHSQLLSGWWLGSSNSAQSSITIPGHGGAKS